MLKTIVCGALVACALPAVAETWHFTYQGFHDSTSGTFIADRQLTGAFTGIDGDGDGIVARSEITSFLLNDYDYVACESQSNEYWKCGLEQFTFGTGGALSFKAGQWGTDPEGWVGGGHYFISGDGEYEYHFRPDHYEESSYRWTDQTSFMISSAPEPATWALLLTGLPLAWAARRRKK
ncbi:putative secreted protein with PEP-CTERM sorting signal [Pseudoduganella flava]|uniref:PEP-CTERM sorting domain-containing protein n=1 Tax=Pseudoduganella flava TaxID=871742 RepID=A0A562PJ10_9BURK|nr:PEP-CTERM sorting domain-containing protein [Pseudoduganella flava]QGZ41997.1 PEP-CTERM sorting domain-containing protein [Pseudoduganella flava]TWI44409.1 putative secreted protein with PEP-CTERM sorting signal [Pseudoduganella flava]